MKNKLRFYDTLIILAMALALVSLIGTWRYYDTKSRRIEEQMERIQKSAHTNSTNQTKTLTLKNNHI